jgi:hemerythrin
MPELDPSLLTGVDSIDRQHRELFARVRALQDSTRTRTSHAEVLRLLDYLDRYAREHFADEEGLMAGAGYPKLDGHREEHRHFLKELAALRGELDRDGATALLVIHTGNRITEWLREHVYRTDLALAAWLRGRR